MELGDPYTREELASAITSTHARSADFFRDIPAGLFFAKPAVGWSPAENLKHLLKSGAALNLGLATPRPLLVVFGSSRQPARRMSEVAELYLERLRAGAGAGLYAPAGEGVAGDEARQAALIAKWLRLGDRFVAQVRRWSEPDLDSYRLPHPILGRIPVREMCLFGMLHVGHHLGKVSERLGRPLP